MKTALMVAEKPSLAASLSTILSGGRHSTRKGVFQFAWCQQQKCVWRGRSWPVVAGLGRSVSVQSVYDRRNNIFPLQASTIPVRFINGMAHSATKVLYSR